MYCPTHSRSFPKWDDVCSRVLHITRLDSIKDAGERMRAIEAYARVRAGESLEEQLASVEDPGERWKVIAAARDLTEEERRILRTLCRERRAAWLRMLRLKKQLKRPLSDPEYLALWYALLLPDVLKKRRDGETIDDRCLEQEAAYMLQVLKWPTDISPINVEPDVIARMWFTVRSQWDEEKADEELRRYIEISPDSALFWEGLNAIADRCQAEQRPIPERLSIWCKEVCEGKHKHPKKVTGGYPPCQRSTGQVVGGRSIQPHDAGYDQMRCSRSSSQNGRQAAVTYAELFGLRAYISRRRQEGYWKSPLRRLPLMGILDLARGERSDHQTSREETEEARESQVGLGR